ncbi:MAG: hypothetical protein ABWW69_05975 [Pyrodictiaceae archaeon]
MVAEEKRLVDKDGLTRELIQKARYCEPFLSLILEKSGLREKPSYRLLVSAIAAMGSLIGYDYCFDIAIEAYYEAKEVLKHTRLSVPRLRKELDMLIEAVEASIAFEESLADEDTLLLAEPILIAAADAICCKGDGVPSQPQPASGSMVVVVESLNKSEKARIEVPIVLARLAFYAISEASGKPIKPYTRARILLVAPDPAYIRRRLFEEKPVLEELGERAYRAYMEACSRIQDAYRIMTNGLDKACDVEEIVIVEYVLEGLAYWRTRYPCT